MKTRKRRVWIYGVCCLGTLVVLAWGIMHWTDTGPDHLLAVYLAGYVETIPDGWVEDELRQMAALEGPGLLVLLAALDSARPEIARSARTVLDQQLASWRDWPLPRASRQISRLARGLAQRVDTWSPTARSVARDLALQILDWPVDRRRVDRAAILADCEHVLRSSLAIPRTAALPPRRDDSAPHAAASAELGLGDRVFAAQRHADVAAAGLHDELPEVPLAERQPADTVALKSAEPLGAEPRLLPRDEGSRGVRQRIGDEADEGEPDETTSAPVSADDPAPATTLPSNNAIASPEDSLLAGMPPGDLPPELALMYELNIPGARSARAEESLRQSGFGDAELSWSRLLVSPQVAHRRQLLEVTGQMLRGSTQWLIWLSHDPEAEVRAAAVGRLITSQAPHVARRLLELECTESDPDICRQLKEWRAAELAGSDATVTKSPYR